MLIRQGKWCRRTVVSRNVRQRTRHALLEGRGHRGLCLTTSDSDLLKTSVFKFTILSAKRVLSRCQGTQFESTDGSILNTAEDDGGSSGEVGEESAFQVPPPPERFSAMYTFLLFYNLLIAYKWPIAMILCTYFAVPALAGKTTNATISVAVELVTKLGEKHPVPWLGAAICFLWALGERWFRRKKTAYLADRNRRLEVMLDPNRTSSNLASHGDSRRRSTWNR